MTNDIITHQMHQSSLFKTLDLKHVGLCEKYYNLN